MKDRQSPTVAVRDLLIARSRRERIACVFAGPTPSAELMGEALGEPAGVHEHQGGPVLPDEFGDAIENFLLSRRDVVGQRLDVRVALAAVLGGGLLDDRAELPRETTLLGFCGAPWTVQRSLSWT